MTQPQCNEWVGGCPRLISLPKIKVWIQLRSFPLSAHSSRPSRIMNVELKPSRILWRVFYRSSRVASWWPLPQQAYRFTKTLGTLPSCFRENCQMSDHISLSWSWKSFGESLLSKKNHAVAELDLWRLWISAELWKERLIQFEKNVEILHLRMVFPGPA